MAATTPPSLPNSLGDIILKVRKITKSPSSNLITDDQIIQYVNTYYLYDFPQEVRVKNTLSNFTFTTIPYQDTYQLPTDSVITIEPPLYIGGYQSYFTQSQEKFYQLYPRLAVQSNAVAGGDGTSGPYGFTLSNAPVFQKNIVIYAQNAAGITMTAVDLPTSTSSGTLQGQYISSGTINYITGEVTGLTFTVSVPSGEYINAESVPYYPSRPSAMLFYNDTLHLRPVPNAPYLVTIQAYVNPIACILGQGYNPPTDGGTVDTNYPSPPNVVTIPTGFTIDSDTPQIKQWWQLIAWGAALKIFEDRGDMESIGRFMPLYQNQKRLVLRRTLVEMSNERVATIYTDQTQYPMGNFYNQF